jgi:hypothetical protein
LFYGAPPTGIGGKGGGLDAQGGNAVMQWGGSASPIAWTVGGGGGGFGASGGFGLGGLNANTTTVKPGGTGGKAVALANRSVIQLTNNGGKIMGGVS